MPAAGELATCLNIPFSVNGKKRKSTVEDSPAAEADHILTHSVDLSDVSSEDNIEMLKRRRLIDNGRFV